MKFPSGMDECFMINVLDQYVFDAFRDQHPRYPFYFVIITSYMLDMKNNKGACNDKYEVIVENFDDNIMQEGVETIELHDDDCMDLELHKNKVDYLT